MRKYLFVFFVLVIHISLKAQFKEGYIITNSNDTIFGQINNDGSVSDSYFCNFKKNLSDTLIAYYPGDIKSFRYLNGKYFISKTVKIDSVYKDVFLEWLIKGKANILAYSGNASDISYYLNLDNDSLIELKNTKSLKRNQYFERKEYVGILNYYLQNADIKSQIDKTQFYRSSLIDIAKEYHYKVCNNEDCIVFESKNHIKVGVGFSLATCNTKLTLHNHIPEKARVNSSLGYNLSFNFSNFTLFPSRFSVQTGLEYHHVKTRYEDYSLRLGIIDSIVGKLPNQIIYYDTIQISPDNNLICEFDLIRIPLMFRYTFPFKIIQPFIGLGFSSNFRINRKMGIPVLANYFQSELFDRKIIVHNTNLLANAGINLMLSTKLGLFFDAECEYGIRFFGNWADDYSYTTNFITHYGVVYYF
jgi:hypothetical protein